MGPGGRGRVGHAAVVGRPRPAPRAPSSARSPRCATTSPARASTTSCCAAWAGRRWRPRSSARPPACELVVLDSSDPDDVRAALADRPRPHRRRRVEQVRLHGRDRLPAARLRAAPSPTPASTRRRRIVIVTDPGSPLDEDARAAGLPRRQRRPRRRRPLLRADRVRAGARAASPASTSRRCSTRPRRSPTCSPPTTRPTRRCASARRWPAPTRCATSSSSSTTAPASSASATGPSSSSPSRTGKDGTGVLPVVVAIGDRPRGPLPAADVTVVRLVADVDDDEPTTRRHRRRRVDRRAPRSRSAARSAPSCCCGRPPPPSPAGCSASTRSTSPTSRAPRRPPASCSTPASAPARAGRFTDGAVEVRALGGDWLGDASTVAGALDALLAPARPRARLRRRDGLPRPARPTPTLAHVRARPSRRAPGARPPSAGGRASCTRPGSTTRAARRPASTCRSPRRPHEDLAVPGPRRSPSATSSPPRPAATPRCSPTTAAPCCACT